MQIVIEVDDDLYTRLFDNGGDNYDDAANMAKAIRKGKVLPKGHGRLIDADAVLVEPFGNTYKDIDIAETIIEADRDKEVNTDADSD